MYVLQLNGYYNLTGITTTRVLQLHWYSQHALCECLLCVLQPAHPVPAVHAALSAEAARHAQDKAHPRGVQQQGTFITITFTAVLTNIHLSQRQYKYNTCCTKHT